MNNESRRLALPLFLLIGLLTAALLVPTTLAARSNDDVAATKDGPPPSAPQDATILLVDDDDNIPNVQTTYTTTLDAIGVAYDIWDTNNSDDEPTAAELAAYNTVIWFSGDEYGGFAGPGADGEAALAAWLDSGDRCLFLSSLDYLWDRDLTAFGGSHLGIASYSSDAGQNTVTGAGTAFSGLGPYVLSYPFANGSDIVNPTAGAEVAFVGNAGNAAVSLDTGNFRTTFWGFPFEAIPAEHRSSVMATLLAWCGEFGDTGLITGTVTEAGSGDPIAGATVSASGAFNFEVKTNASGSYTLTVAAGTYDVAVTAAGYVADRQEGVAVAAGETVVLDFGLELAFGELRYSPAHLEQTLVIGKVATQTMTITNSGTISFNFTLRDSESGSPLLTSTLPLRGQTFDEPTLLVAPEARNASSAAGLNLPRMQGAAAPLAAGDVIDSWPLTDLFGWGIAFDGEHVWISSPVISWGGNSTLNRFTVDGSHTGVTYPYSWAPENGPADATYNWNTGNLWILDVGTDNCLHEMSPTAGETGNSICPGFSVSQRGLAYDPVTDTYFAGGWNDRMIYHFDSAGTILSQTYVGLGISGLAYNPDTNHLFVMTNASPNLIYVLDAANAFATVGQFEPGWGPTTFTGAGLEIDCDGNLWAINQVSQEVYLMDSGESSLLCADAPWLHQLPGSGTVDAGDEPFEVKIVFDATAITTTGTYTANITFYGTFDNGPAPATAVMHVVPPSYGVAVSSDQAATGNAGEVVSYTVEVTNEGNVTDSFDLALSGGAWAATLSHSSVTLAAGASTAVTVEVTAPASALTGESDVVTFTAASVSDPSATASSDLSTTAVAIAFLYVPTMFGP